MKGENMMSNAHKANDSMNDAYRKNYEKIFRKKPNKGRNDPISKEEIDEVKEEYLQKTVIGSDPPIPVEITTSTAEYVIRARRSHQDWLNSVDESHDMTDWRSEVRAPAGTERFYSVRNCVNCEYEMSEHPAGRFMDYQLKRECRGI